LSSLPPGYSIASSGEARFIAGPPGAFVLLAAGGGAGNGADRAALLASTTRTALAEHLTWVPFIDAIVVTTEPSMSTAATPVPLDLLSEMLTEGPIVIDAGVLETIRSLIAEQRLSTWRTGLGLPADKIDLCDPA